MLRSPDLSSCYACGVNDYGGSINDYYVDFTDFGVRPALRLNLLEIMKDEAKAELAEAKINAVSDEAKAAIDTAIENVNKATNPDAVASAKAEGTRNAENADNAYAEKIKFDNVNIKVAGGCVYIDLTDSFSGVAFDNCRATECGGVVYTDDAEACVQCSNRIFSIVPPYSGKNAINEGAFFVKNGTHLFIVYSGNGCRSDDDCSGVLEYTGGDMCSKNREKNHRSRCLLKVTEFTTPAIRHSFTRRTAARAGALITD